MSNEESVVPAQQTPPKGVISVWTMQLGKWRAANERNIPFLDVTAKTGLADFAPDMRDVMAYKRGELTEAVYTDIYIGRMRQSYLHNRDGVWDKLFKDPQIALACYCGKDKFCHRHILVDLIEKVAPLKGYAIQRMGELE